MVRENRKIKLRIVKTTLKLENLFLKNKYFFIILFLNIYYLFGFEIYLMPDDRQKYIYQLFRDLKQNSDEVYFFGEEIYDKNLFYALKKSLLKNAKIKIIVAFDSDKKSSGYTAQLLPFENVEVKRLKAFRDGILKNNFVIINSQFLYIFSEKMSDVEIAIRSTDEKDILELKNKFEILWNRGEKIDLKKCKN